KRAARSQRELTALLLGEANIETMLIDTGFGGPDTLSIPEMRELTGCRVDWVLRLEVLAQGLIAENAEFSTFRERLTHALTGLAGQGIVSLKSIAAYRTGLEIQPVSE